MLLKKQQKVWEEGTGGGLTKPVIFPTHISMAETWSPGVISDKVSLLSLPSSSFTGGMAWRTLFMRGGSVGREDHEFLSLQSEGAQDPRFPFGLPLHSFPANLSQAFSTAWGCCGQSAGPALGHVEPHPIGLCPSSPCSEHYFPAWLCHMEICAL